MQDSYLPCTDTTNTFAQCMFCCQPADTNITIRMPKSSQRTPKTCNTLEWVAMFGLHTKTEILSMKIAAKSRQLLQIQVWSIRTG